MNGGHFPGAAYAQINKGPGRLFQIIGEVFRRHGRRGEGDDGVFAEGLFQGLFDGDRGLFVIDQGYITFYDLNCAIALVGFRRILRDLYQIVAKLVAIFLRIGADRALDGHFVRNNIVLVFSVDGADGDHRRR